MHRHRLIAPFFLGHLSKYDEVAQDHDLLVDLLSDGPPQLMFVRSSPRWAGL